jgi:hypothetical protein
LSQGDSADTPIFSGDPWRTLYRPLPKDVYDAVKQCEDMIGIEIGNMSSENRSMGQSVAVWTILTQFLLEKSEELKAKAREWADKE